ncbi:hypothetical protein BGX26_004221 [Mortierella sp. AD094]|nr:hypothetical protein BGX26_004221 [Mortierella sp. AD094]
MTRLHQHPCYRVLGTGAVLAFVLSLASLNLVTGYAGTHPTNLDVHMREMLCTNQMGMCQASCQNNIQLNICDSETLEWNCVCTSGTSKMFNDWQFPIPFKLCRRSLLTCLKSCPGAGNIDMDQEVEGSDDGEDAQGESTRQKQQFRMSPPVESEGYLGDDYDEDDYDAIEEIQQPQRHSKLLEDSYSLFEKEGQARIISSEKKRQLHKQLWAKQRREIISEKNWIENNNGDKPRKDITAFTTLSDPAVRRDAACVSRCQVAYSCGTETAPEFHGVLEISRSEQGDSVAQDINVQKKQEI